MIFSDFKAYLHWNVEIPFEDLAKNILDPLSPSTWHGCQDPFWIGINMLNHSIYDNVININEEYSIWAANFLVEKRIIRFKLDKSSRNDKGRQFFIPLLWGLFEPIDGLVKLTYQCHTMLPLLLISWMQIHVLLLFKASMKKDIVNVQLMKMQVSASYYCIKALTKANLQGKMNPGSQSWPVE